MLYLFTTCVITARYFCSILKLFLDVWVAYAEVILWAKKRSRALDHQLEEQEKPNGICAVSASKDANHGDISNLEFVAFLRTIVGDMNQEKQRTNVSRSNTAVVLSLIIAEPIGVHPVGNV